MLEAYSFGHIPVERQSAWAFGLNGQREFEFNSGLSVTPFFGPAFVRIRVIDGAANNPPASATSCCWAVLPPPRVLTP